MNCEFPLQPSDVYSMKKVCGNIHRLAENVFRDATSNDLIALNRTGEEITSNPV